MLIIFIALVVRLLYFREAIQSPYFDAPFLDELYHQQWAEEIASGRVLNERVFFRAPLYAYLLATKFFLLGKNTVSTKLFQHIIGVITSVLIFLVTFLLFGQKETAHHQHSPKNKKNEAVSHREYSIGLVSAVISALIYAFYAPVVFFEGELLDIFLSCFFYALLLFLLLSSRRWTASKTAFFIIGFLLGISAIARPNCLIFSPFILLYLLYSLIEQKKIRTIILTCSLFVLGLLLPILPVTIHNAVVGHCFVPISTYDGINFYIGNNHTADGYTPKTTRRYFAGGRYRDSVELFAEKESTLLLGYEPNARQIKAYWYKRAFQEIKHYPRHFFTLLIKKFILFWNAFEIKNNKNIYVVAEFCPWLNFLLSLFNFGTVVPLALSGLFMALIFLKDIRRELLLFLALIIAFSFSVVLFFVTSRHRLPIIPLLVPFAGYGAVFFLKAVAEINWKKMILFISLLGLFTLAVNHDWYDIRRTEKSSNLAKDYWSVANCFAQKGDFSSAKAYYQKALAYDPEFCDALNNLGTLLFKQGQYHQAARYFERAIQLDPHYVKGYYNLGVYYEEVGELSKAFQMYKKAILLAPGGYERAMNAVNRLSAILSSPHPKED
ncbi:tetratricopeptide repeat protein [Candidatus Sumerlaeota bacterium]|nr:tetratricopeptide repeat protein [Candidatus Sumerlaeota bacterium]